MQIQSYPMSKQELQIIWMRLLLWFLVRLFVCERRISKRECCQKKGKWPTHRAKCKLPIYSYSAWVLRALCIASCFFWNTVFVMKKRIVCHIIKRGIRSITWTSFVLMLSAEVSTFTRFHRTHASASNVVSNAKCVAVLLWRKMGRLVCCAAPHYTERPSLMIPTVAQGNSWTFRARFTRAIAGLQTAVTHSFRSLGKKQGPIMAHPINSVHSLFPTTNHMPRLQSLPNHSEQVFYPFLSPVQHIESKILTFD